MKELTPNKEVIHIQKGNCMSNSNSKQSKKLNSSKPTKSAGERAVIASQATGITGESPAPDDVEKNQSVTMPTIDKSEPSTRRPLASLQGPVEGYNSLRALRRLTYRWPRDRQSRKHASTFIICQLLEHDLPIPHDDEILEELGARHFELVRMIAREGATPEEVERCRAFLKEFLILACAPESAPAAAESEAA
jgi:hypothetical protein